MTRCEHGIDIDDQICYECQRDDAERNSNTSDGDIKPCPSCDCDQIHTEEREWVKPFAKYCRNCRMYGPIADTEAEAIELWNELPRAK